MEDNSKETTPTTKHDFSWAKSGKTRLKAKLQLARKMLLERMGGKSGANDYQKFNYFELKDFLPHIINIFEELHLYDQMLFEEGGISKLRIEDLETGEYTFPSTYPTPERARGNTNQQAQSVGAIKTYTKRYLLMDALNIVENDVIDATSGQHKLSVEEVKKHMQETLQDTSNMKEAKKELDKLKIEEKITQKTYEVMYNTIKKAGGK